MIQEQKNTRARAVAAAITETKAGKEQVAISFELLDGPNAGQTMGWWGSLSDAAAPYTAKALRALGWKVGAVEVVAGTECKVTVVLEDYQGKVSPRIKWINSLTSALEALPPERAASALSRLNAASAALDTAPVAQAEPPPHTDNDALPF